jgi:hypothetical protein
LWRGVWPLNITSPFFGFIILGGMTVGAGVLYAGLISPSGKLVFENQTITAERHFLWGKTRQVIRQVDIEHIETEERYSSEGPNDWYGVILLKNGKDLTSRPLQTKAAAERLVGQWQGFLA